MSIVSTELPEGYVHKPKPRPENFFERLIDNLLGALYFAGFFTGFILVPVLSVVLCIVPGPWPSKPPYGYGAEVCCGTIWIGLALWMTWRNRN